MAILYTRNETKWLPEESNYLNTIKFRPYLLTVTMLESGNVVEHLNKSKRSMRENSLKYLLTPFFIKELNKWSDCFSINFTTPDYNTQKEIENELKDPEMQIIYKVKNSKMNKVFKQIIDETLNNLLENKSDKNISDIQSESLQKFHGQMKECLLFLSLSKKEFDTKRVKIKL